MRAPLDVAVTLLQKYGRERQAKHLVRLAALAGSGDVRFLEAAVSEGVWGGPGAVWDFRHFDSSRVSSAEAQQDIQLFVHALIVFADHLEAAGIANARTRDCANRLRGFVGRAV